MPTAILFDLDGVLYVAERAVPGAAETVRWVREQRIPHLFVTNTTSRPRDAIVRKLGGFGIDVGEDEVLTPAVAAVRWLSARRAEPVALFVPEATRSDFERIRQVPDDAEEGAAAVVIGDLGEGWTFAHLNRAFRLLMTDVECHLLALGTTRYWRAEDGLRLDAGPFVKALEYASGRAPVVLGKPDRAFFANAAEELGVAASEVIMVGDDIVGDVDGAQRAGMRGVLVRTGKYGPRDLARGIEPAAVLDSVAELPTWLRTSRIL